MPSLERTSPPEMLTQPLLLLMVIALDCDPVSSERMEPPEISTLPPLETASATLWFLPPEDLIQPLERCSLPPSTAILVGLVVVQVMEKSPPPGFSALARVMSWLGPALRNAVVTISASSVMVAGPAFSVACHASLKSI